MSDINVRPATEADLTAMAFAENADRHKHRLDPQAIESLKRFAFEHIRPGSFLSAVISNDLADACKRADMLNRRKLFEYVEWLYNNAPGDSWGSEEKMEAWIKLGEEKLGVDRG